jgi:hypothetical protein
VHANTPRSHMHSFCATGVRIGLATRMTLTQVSRGKLGSRITGGESVSDFMFVPYYATAVKLGFKWDTLYY